MYYSINIYLVLYYESLINNKISFDNSLLNNQNNNPEGIAVFPVPDNALELSQSGIYQYFTTLFQNEAHHHYAYRDLQGRVLGYISRWNRVRQMNGDIKKEILSSASRYNWKII